MKKIFFASLLAFIIIIAAISTVFYWANKAGPLYEAATISISRGSTVRAVAKDMEAIGMIDKAWLLELAARIKKADRKLRAGEYYFPANISIVEILEKLEKGDVFYHRITLPEGLTTQQFFSIIDMEENLTGEITVDVKEGEMLAETYTFSKDDSRDSVVIQARDALTRVLNEAWEKRKETLLEDKYQALILASIIEKETSIPEERGLVASVFINRLRIGMLLQTDPTVIYALTEGKGFLGRSLKKADLQMDSPYNTYKHKGLPPTPICNVSADSIEAALNYEDTDFLYFVADGKGGHQFSENYDSHRKKVSEWISTIRK
ncbi:MAG: endolytic transglycosylase MltG [Lactobacillaceae bacterium]|jgi:UPF0755 protein|nr:endolytic transglycosylase MltG [Lactobacillaceae bacterium]